MLKFNRVALSDWLITVLNARGPFTCHFYSNDFDPDAGAVLGDFTEAAFTGYAAATLGARTDAIVGDDAKASWPDVSMLCTDGVCDLYGYFITDGGGAYVWGERDPTADEAVFTIAPGRTYTVSPRLILQNMP